jgi:RNA polymerase sigma-70 factor (ECF subfamily)
MSLDDPISGQDGVTLLDTVAEDDGYLAWMGSSTNPVAALEDRLSINRALNTLGPGHINWCAKLVTGSIGRIGGESRSSRATLYRQLREVRLQLLAAGIGPCG